jgi:Putative DNA-binding domain
MDALFETLTSIESVQALIDTCTRESEVLEYKLASMPFSDKEKIEVAKDVSAMANSLGGVIIYGVACDQADKTRPVHIEPIDPKNIETLDRVLNAQVRPALNGMRRRVLPPGDPKVLVVAVPESDNPPHQSLYDKRYYRRSGSECLPMEHDLVALKFGRKTSPVLEVVAQSVSQPNDGGMQGDWVLSARLRLHLRNLGRRVARDVVGILKFPDIAVMQIQSVSGQLLNIDSLHTLRQVRQFDLAGSVAHPGLPISFSELLIRFSNTAQLHLSSNPLIEWTVYADEMEPRQGVITMESLGWQLPQ